MDYLEIDLRELLKKILKKWVWIIILAFVVGGGAFLFSFTQPDMYQARATFAVTDPRYTANFDERYTTNDPGKPAEDTVRNLVLNDEIVKQLYDLWDSPDKAESTLADFKDLLDVVLGDKGMTVTLKVQSKDAEQAAFLANRWAELALAKVNEIFYGVTQDQISLFDAQLTSTKSDLDSASNALENFASENTLPMLRNELTGVLAAQAETAQKTRMIETALLDLGGLAEQLKSEPDSDALDISYRISALLVQSRLYSSPVVTGVLTTELETFDVNAANAGTGLQFDLDGLNDETTVGEFEEMLESWIAVLDSQIQTLTDKQARYPSLVTDLQTQIQTLENQEQLLNLDFSVQMDAYEIIARKYEEVALTTMDGDGEFARMISQAVVPDNQVPHNTIRNTAIGLAAGGFLAIAGIIAFDWWNLEPSKPKIEEA